MAPLTPQNATIVFVHGAWHSHYHYSSLLDGLRNHGWTVRASSMPSTGSSFPDLTQDIATVRQDIDAALAEGKDVAILAHSWGGIPASEAVQGYVKDESSNKPGVVKLMYIASFAIPKGETLASSHGDGNLPKWQEITPDGKFVIAVPGREREIFYGDDCKDEAQAKDFVAHLKPQRLHGSLTPVTWEPYRVIDSAYVVCNQDGALQPDWQEQFVRDTGIKKVVRMDSSHSPWVKHNDKLLKAVFDFLGDKM